ncbi:hypothetical protein UFOVP594_2 [uncultured Caudovirales phage]|uniref:Uncharacterized protein n=1 Tax=uncultured Caudovirales phage TaxID=2100421 RepID=A0A6J5MVA4_9CAUD|nr:hypothetical protein UFOVP594_2 [uncultured Caudovirales phage]
MKWENLAKNLCPKCCRDFTRGLSVTKEKGVMLHGCGFSIGESKFKQIVFSINNGNLEREKNAWPPILRENQDAIDQ